ncbi:MAG: SUKH-4 family immunity protein [Myxococcota bacterium]|nr:SUKH-4 family immunity protein [Myxococcota bacterium]
MPAELPRTLWSLDTQALEYLSASDVRFLTTVGLPSSEEGYLAIPPTTEALDRCPPDHLALAEDGPTVLCAGPMGVIAIEPDGSRFVNGSVEQLSKMLELYSQYRESVRTLSDEEAEALVSQVALRMTLCDPLALEDPDSYWSVILEQMEHGHL